MTELTATQRQNAQNIMNGTAQVHSSMWTAANTYLQQVGLPKVNWAVGLGQLAFQHTISNVAVNEFSDNPNKYVIQNTLGAVSGLAGMWAGAKGGGFLGGATAGPAGVIPGAVAGAAIGAGFGDAAFQEMFEHAYNNWPALRNWVNNFDPSSPSTYIPPEVQKYFNDVAKETAEAVNKFAEDMKNNINKTFDDVSKYLSEAYESIINDLAEVYDFVAAQLSSLLNNVGDFLSEVWEGIKDWFEDLFGDDAPQQANPQTPIVFDMDGDGIELVSLSSSRVYFDIENKINKNATNDNLIIDKRLNFNKIAA
jgi:hypothetical protein